MFSPGANFLESSVTMARAATAWPAFSMRSTSVAPDLSSAKSRVSETVSTAILSGTNVRLWSMPGTSFHSCAEANVLQLCTEPD